jgi:hypothetical protein
VTVEKPKVRFVEAQTLTRRLQYINEGVEQFWKKWMHLVFKEKLMDGHGRKQEET